MPSRTGVGAAYGSGVSSTPLPLSLSPAGRRHVRSILIVAAAIGVAIGLNAFVLHLTTDPLADVRAYYDAGARLNAGQPLYVQPATTDDPSFYRYPPLLAILFRPLAVLPFETAAVVWELLLVTSTVVVVWRLGIREPVLIALGILAMPLLWTLAIGQAQALVTMLLALASPLTVAAAGHLKLLPWLVALVWVGRRDWRALGRFIAWFTALWAVQLVLEPAGTVAFLSFPSLTHVGEVVNLSPYAVHPALWAVLAAAGMLVVLRLAASRWGWPAAVAYAVLVSPRLLAYQLSTLLAAFGERRRTVR